MIHHVIMLEQMKLLRFAESDIQLLLVWINQYCTLDCYLC